MCLPIIVITVFVADCECQQLLHLQMPHATRSNSVGNICHIIITTSHMAHEEETSISRNPIYKSIKSHRLEIM